MKRMPGRLCCLMWLATTLYAAPKQHVVSFGKWVTVRWFFAEDERSARDVKIRPLLVDGRSDVSTAEEFVLESFQRPIVLLRRRTDAHIGIAEDVAPGNDHLGVVLPYTPLHHLLLAEGKIGRAHV